MRILFAVVIWAKDEAQETKSRDEEPAMTSNRGRFRSTGRKDEVSRSRISGPLTPHRPSFTALGSLLCPSYHDCWVWASFGDAFCPVETCWVSLHFAKADRCQSGGFSLGFARSPGFPISQTCPLRGIMVRRSPETPENIESGRVRMNSVFAKCTFRNTGLIDELQLHHSSVAPIEILSPIPSLRSISPTRLGPSPTLASPSWCTQSESS